MMGGAGETPFEIRRRLLNDREKKLRKKLEAVVERRKVERENRFKRAGLPVVAVVGYTNSGKTSLIKALTNDVGLSPENRLFATVDVTTHECLTPTGIRYLLVDTVGFLSNLPTFLIASFGATLDDAVAADLLLHVRDVSHPCFRQQKNNVVATLESLGVSPDKMDGPNYLETWNKIDLVADEWMEWEEKVERMEGGGGDVEEEEEEDVERTRTSEDGTTTTATAAAATTTTTTTTRTTKTPPNSSASETRSLLPCKISATERTGLADLNRSIEDAIVRVAGYEKRAVVLKLTDQPAMTWLWSESTVISVQPLEEALGENLISVEAWMSPSARGKFLKRFPGYFVKEL